MHEAATLATFQLRSSNLVSMLAFRRIRGLCDVDNAYSQRVLRVFCCISVLDVSFHEDAGASGYRGSRCLGPLPHLTFVASRLPVEETLALQRRVAYVLPLQSVPASLFDGVQNSIPKLYLLHQIYDPVHDDRALH